MTYIYQIFFKPNRKEHGNQQDDEGDNQTDFSE